ncbi:MAG: AAA domain-containing protein [Deltaproteobacteria bacterium]|nr:AAA domain-containing protein [Deltaproteobacteria bacterium]
MTKRRDIDRHSILLSALHEVAGAAIVLDADLRVIAHTVDVPALVGGPVELGVFAPQMLCGEGAQRPVAEALAEGRAIVAEVPRPTPDGGSRVILVRASPLLSKRVRVGFILLLEGEPWESEGPGAAVVVHGIHTRDSSMKRLLRDVDRVARRSATVLVRGETGAGKELVARAVHAASDRAAGPFRAINCAALPPHLLESTLFGHMRGAFTGAVRDEPGHFRLADSGTLFLDEVAELSLALQAKLLRVLEDRSVIPVGGREPVPVDVRIISATHRSLRDAVAAGSFRADLMYRLRVVPLFIPPLRERVSDIELLAWRFIEARNDPGSREVARIAPTALRKMTAYAWPGNVRELENAIEYAFAMGEGPVLTEAHLPPEVRGRDTRTQPARNVPLEHDPASGDDDLPDEARRLLYAIERSAGHRGRAAASLGMSRVTLWRKLKRYGLLDSEG